MVLKYRTVRLIFFPDRLILPFVGGTVKRPLLPAHTGIDTEFPFFIFCVLVYIKLRSIPGAKQAIPSSWLETMEIKRRSGSASVMVIVRPSDLTKEPFHGDVFDKRSHPPACAVKPIPEESPSVRRIAPHLLTT